MKTAMSRPPAGVWLRYRLLGMRVPSEYLPWVERDIRSSTWLLRTRLIWPLISIALVLIFNTPWEDPRWAGIGIAAGVAVVLLIRYLGRKHGVFERDRRMFLEYQRGERPHPMIGTPSTRRDLLWTTAASVAIAGVIVVVVRAFFT